MAATVAQILQTVTAIGTSITAIRGDIQSLKDQLAAGGMVTQEDLDTILANLENVASQAATLDSETPAP